jgi:hypothetical protein
MTTASIILGDMPRRDDSTYWQLTNDAREGWFERYWATDRKLSAVTIDCTMLSKAKYYCPYTRMVHGSHPRALSQKLTKERDSYAPETPKDMQTLFSVSGERASDVKIRVLCRSLRRNRFIWENPAEKISINMKE